jgi:hypothetical protein
MVRINLKGAEVLTWKINDWIWTQIECNFSEKCKVVVDPIGHKIYMIS